MKGNSVSLRCKQQHCERLSKIQIIQWMYLVECFVKRFYALYYKYTILYQIVSSKFRCSDHKCLIETGLHLGITREQRICQY